MSRDIIVGIIGDASSFNRATASATSNGQKFGNILTGIGQGIGHSFVGFAEDAARAVGDFIGGSISKASDLNESMNKSEVVFGTSAAGIKEWANTAATSLGMSSQAAIENAATLGNLFEGAGVAQKGAADLSKNIVQLASDLGSFNNIDPTEALDKLKSGLVGEVKPLRDLGVNLSEAVVNAKATEMGFKMVNGVFTDAQKIQARYQVILEQTKNAQGDFARTADGLANSQRTANAQLDDAQALLGQKMLPVQLAVTKAQIGFVDAITGSTRDVVQSLEQETADMITQGVSSGDLQDHYTTLLAEKKKLTGPDAGTIVSQSELDSLDRSIYATQGLIDKDKSLGAAARATRDDYTGAWISMGKATDDIVPKAAQKVWINFGPGGYVPNAFDYSALRSKVMIDSIHHNLTDAAGTVKGDAQALSDAMKDPLSGPKRIKEIKDELTGKNSVGKQLIAGLKSSDPLVKEAAKKLQQDLKDELKGLAIEYAVNFSTEHKGDTPHHASGGFAPSGQLAMFGEQGPELGIPGAGGYNILTAAQTRNVLSSHGSSPTINININSGAYIDGPSVDRLARLITQRLRLTGIA